MKENKPRNYGALAKAIELQQKSNNPRELKDAYKRLKKSGYDDEAIRDMCVWVLAAEYFRMLVHKKAFDINRYALDFKRLPLMPWDEDSGQSVDMTQDEVREAILDNPDLLMETTEETRDRYNRIRPKLKEIHNEMLQHADQLILFKSAQALGQTQGEAVAVDSEDTLSVIADHFIYADPKHRRKLVKAYRKRHGKSLDPEYEEILDAILHARYTMVRCEGVIPRLGVQVHDLINDEVFRLVDLNLAKSAKPGFMLVSYIIAPYGIYMTTGAPLPIMSDAALDEIKKVAAHIAQDETTSYEADQKELATAVTRTLLQHACFNSCHALQLHSTP